MKQHASVNLMLLVLALIVFGCSGGDNGQGVDDAGAKGTGTLALRLTDAPAGDVQAVYISIKAIEICTEATEENTEVNLQEADDGCVWDVISQPGEIYNLLELVNGVTETLGEVELPAGTYHQMRLMIDTESDNDAESDKGFNLLGEEHPYANYLITKENALHPLNVPGGVQSGVKLVHEFEINENQYTELILDFDARKSIVKAGNKNTYILKPTINVMNTKHVVRLAGTVTDTNEAPLESVTVSAQSMEDPAGLVVEASTATDETGGYQLFLEKNKAYTLVVFSNTHTPACVLIHISDEDLHNWNFSLEAAQSSREVTGTVTGAAEGSDVHLSVRTDQTCGSGAQEIELLSETFTHDENVYAYSVTLPVDSAYQVVYSDGVNNAFKTFAVTAGQGPQTEDLVLGAAD